MLILFPDILSITLITFLLYPFHMYFQWLMLFLLCLNLKKKKKKKKVMDAKWSLPWQTTSLRLVIVCHWGLMSSDRNQNHPYVILLMSVWGEKQLQQSAMAETSTEGTKEDLNMHKSDGSKEKKSRIRDSKLSSWTLINLDGLKMKLVAQYIVLDSMELNRIQNL